MKVTVDIGDPEPAGAVAAESLCESIFDDEWGERLRFGKTFDGSWKTHLNGKTYMSWDDMLRRFGPLEVELEAGES
ncbi:hypothetical protein [Mycolicibacterium fortuitum]|uniref:hypothetical protein n=1 Tax=Mycolicibacterium fortuitum TaxID=1766 RepID=UPI0026289E30|nr:hypothetical protein [Mycolicibacterium fortuitum]